MTETRYRKSILRVIKTGVIDEHNNELNTDEVVALLNKQHEQIELKNKEISDANHTIQEQHKMLNTLYDENEQLKQRIKSRLHYYRALCNEFDKDNGFTYDIVKRIVEDLEDILK